MKLLRILTGVHAGAQMQLAPGTHRVGADDEADIQLNDWRGASALLHVDAAGVVSAQRGSDTLPEQAAPVPADGEAIGEDRQSASGDTVPSARGDAPEPQDTVLLVDFVPMQFDEIVLCVGADDATWPSDLDLLSMLLTRPAEAKFAAARRKERRYIGVVAACVLAGVLIAAISFITSTQMSRAASPANADEHARQINAALVGAHVHGVTARALGNSVVVSGMVATSTDDDAVRTLLERIAPTGVLRNYDVAQNDVRSIEESLGVSGAHVRYVGDGDFAVTGAVANKADLDTALERVRGDLNSNVKRITVEVTETAGIGSGMANSTSYSEMISSGDVKYAQTPDGVKHIYAVDLPDASSVPPAAAQADTSAAAAASSVSPAAAQAASPRQPSSIDTATVNRSAQSVGLPELSTLPSPASTHAQAN
jgi:type III secretion protein D